MPPVDLTDREIRALHGAAEMTSEVFASVLTSHPRIRELLEHDGVPPLESAAMKLELALVTSGIDL